jgi:hypothetical protein
MIVGKKCNPGFLVAVLAVVLLFVAYLVFNHGVNRERPAAPMHQGKIGRATESVGLYS